MVATFSGGAAAAVAAWFAPWQLTALIGWDVVALVVLLLVWHAIGGLNPQETAALATREDDSRAAADLLLLAAAGVSLVGVALAFVKANDSGAVLQPLLRSLGVFTIICSWVLVHTQFALRYAHLYYAEPVGGIDFKARDEEPDYRDFAYTAFTVGMTFQVSDTDITRRVLRRAVLRHALLSFLFGAVILATAINVLAGLFN
jgi:uncharacterized membrane protein